MRSLIKLLTHEEVAAGSPVYILTDSAIADVPLFSEKLYNRIAEKHVSVSYFIDLEHYNNAIHVDFNYNLW